MHMGPRRLLHGLPMPECLQTPVEHELRLVLLLRDGRHDALIEARRQAIGLNIGDKAVAVFLADKGFDILGFARHGIPVCSMRYSGCLNGVACQVFTRISEARSATRRPVESKPAN